jgi:(R,R)-butanediol dehydrogenase / meso-butanediol dehydrogenase / diacetyl reductase
MKAARFHDREDLRIEDVAEPAPARGEAKLRNAFSGICGSDLHLYYAPERTGMDLTTPHPLTGAIPPQILGHEFSGVVTELGPGVDRVSVGDRVAVYPLYSCGACDACTQGRHNICRMVAFHGLRSHGGGMAEFTTIAAEKLHVLPDSVDLRMGALVEPMAVGWHAVERSGVQRGQSALVAGGGPIGLGVWFALRAREVERIVISETSAVRRRVLEGLGATTVDSASAGSESQVAFDVAFDAAGAGSAVTSAIKSLAPGGRLVVLAVHEQTMAFNPAQLLAKEVELVGSLAYLPRDFDEVIHAMATGLYDTKGWVNQRPLGEALSAIEDLRAGQAMKTLISIPQ